MAKRPSLPPVKDVGFTGSSAYKSFQGVMISYCRKLNHYFHQVRHFWPFRQFSKQKMRTNCFEVRLPMSSRVKYHRHPINLPLIYFTNLKFGSSAEWPASHLRPSNEVKDRKWWSTQCHSTTSEIRPKKLPGAVLASRTSSIELNKASTPTSFSGTLQTVL